MTIIAAKQFEDKWTLFTDDCVTMWQIQVSAAKKYRPKMREIFWKKYHLIVASCWGTREIDVVLNLLEAKLEISKVKDTIGLWYVIQDVLIEAFKALNEIAKDPAVWLLILEVNSNTLWHTDDYSVFRVNDDSEIVAWSWESVFLSMNKYENFLGSLKTAVKADEFCEFPIYAYRDGEMFSFYPYQNEYEMAQTLVWQTVSHEDATHYANEERREPSWLTEYVATELW